MNSSSVGICTFQGMTVPPISMFWNRGGEETGYHFVFNASHLNMIC